MNTLYQNFFTPAIHFQKRWHIVKKEEKNMQLWKILKKEMAKSNDRAELVKVPQERSPDAESLRKLDLEVDGLLWMTENQVLK